MNNEERVNNIIQNENGEWVPAEPIPYYPPKKRSFKEIVVSTIRILLGKDWWQNDEELVKRLRHDSESRALMLEASDAIEELTGFVQEAERDRDEYRERLERTNELLLNRWISVTERLPEDRSDVLAYLKYEVGGRIAAANYDKGMWQDCVMGGLYRTEEGVVTHWMPIPQPPKEENND